MCCVLQLLINIFVVICCYLLCFYLYQVFALFSKRQRCTTYSRTDPLRLRCVAVAVAWTTGGATCGPVLRSRESVLVAVALRLRLRCGWVVLRCVAVRYSRIPTTRYAHKISRPWKIKLVQMYGPQQK